LFRKDTSSAFYPKESSNLSYSFGSCPIFCIFLPFLSSKHGETTLKGNSNYSIFDENLNQIYPNSLDYQIKIKKPFFIHLNHSITKTEVNLQFELEETSDDADGCAFEPFSVFDFNKGFISKNGYSLNYSTSCSGNIPVWAIVVLVVGILLIIGLIFLCCFCGCCCACCYGFFTCIKLNHSQTSSINKDSVEMVSVRQQNPYDNSNVAYGNWNQQSNNPYGGYQNPPSSVPPVHPIYQ
jgi:hypothetical protein